MITDKSGSNNHIKIQEQYIEPYSPVMAKEEDINSVVTLSVVETSRATCNAKMTLG